jgi:hypothetical protein
LCVEQVVKHDHHNEYDQPERKVFVKGVQKSSPP